MLRHGGSRRAEVSGLPVRRQRLLRHVAATESWEARAQFRRHAARDVSGGYLYIARGMKQPTLQSRADGPETPSQSQHRRGPPLISNVRAPVKQQNGSGNRIPGITARVVVERSNKSAASRDLWRGLVRFNRQQAGPTRYKRTVVNLPRR